MGDFWDRNILVEAREPTPRIYVLDWELAKRGLPGFDLGVFCGSINFPARGDKVASESAGVILQNFVDAYARSVMNSGDDVMASLAQDTLFHWGGCNLFWGRRYLPRERGVDREVIQALVREGVDFLVRSRDTEFLAQSPVQGLLPK
jgi:aminoglycoside phosphotransferase (APT) family kinase protein